MRLRGATGLAIAAFAGWSVMAGAVQPPGFATPSSQPNRSQPPRQPSLPPEVRTPLATVGPAAPAATPALAGWLDAPLTPGTWVYGQASGVSRAGFGLPGRPVFELRCDNRRKLVVTRGGARGPMTIRTTSTARTLSGGNAASLEIAVNDPILDAMAFSRGRFAVEAPGVAPLVVPAWSEVGRIIEDCRRGSRG